mmetsp:Transcript_5663/g.13515  ORF Transcript_5663/g.13515 Transcript_5663/m.13515 type:complete len:202 (-) Transcript_5663:1139-1744(-)
MASADARCPPPVSEIKKRTRFLRVPSFLRACETPPPLITAARCSRELMSRPEPPILKELSLPCPSRSDGPLGDGARQVRPPILPRRASCERRRDDSEPFRAGRPPGAPLTPSDICGERASESARTVSGATTHCRLAAPSVCALLEPSATKATSATNQCITTGLLWRRRFGGSGNGATRRPPPSLRGSAPDSQVRSRHKSDR